MVTRMWFTFPGWFWQHWEPSRPIDPTILRKLILRIYWDDSRLPSVQSPFGDFFGVGHCEYKHWTSRFLGMSSGGFYCYFPMPFRSMRVEVENMHESMDVQLFANVTWNSEDREYPEAGRFHCAYLQQENTGHDPIRILDAQGRGHFVGCCLSIQGRDPGYLAYLEAPEHVFLDCSEEGEPTIVGTGMEDYFNGGWYFRDGEFQAPLHGVPIKDALRSMVTMYRFHDQDAFVFNRSISFQFRNPWNPDRLKPFRSSSTAYWYQDKATGVPMPIPPAAELMRLYRIRDADHQSIP